MPMEGSGQSERLPLTDRQQQIAELWNQGMTHGQIAKQLGITKGSIPSTLKLIQKKDFPLRTIDKIKSFENDWLSGYPIWKMRDKYNLPDTWAVREKARKLNLPARDCKYYGQRQ